MARGQRQTHQQDGESRHAEKWVYEAEDQGRGQQSERVFGPDQDDWGVVRGVDARLDLNVPKSERLWQPDNAQA